MYLEGIILEKRNIVDWGISSGMSTNTSVKCHVQECGVVSAHEVLNVVVKKYNDGWGYFHIKYPSLTTPHLFISKAS
jgi:hypothetical protein